MDADDMTTRPTMETVLERINTIGENLSRQILSVENQLNTRFDLLEQWLQSQIDEIRLILRDFSRKIDALNKNFYSYRPITWIYESA
jgi:archaellum component FlaC